MFLKSIYILALTSFLYAGSYIVPQEYDNMVNSTKSKAFGVITQATADISATTYIIGGQSVRFRCLRVPKIDCRASTAQISVNISEVSLKRPTTEELLMTFQSDIRVEEDSANDLWFLCGGAYGGQIWDNSTMTSSTDASGNTQIDYQYAPNANIEEYFYFTNQANTSSQSYMTITYSQTCQ